ncbi:LysE family translocator [Piscinibacter sp.]|uniref:LysE family translocator n=1 Tax=Piscinibacter sp. TaxID=1903157 RepID=UPI002D127A2C|nr:LysE family translocator [Albitalea sp.]HUG21752.1 LysE family translocator [Albitalea sp.]
MDGQTWLAFSAVAVLVIVLPGPAALLCVSHGLQHGRRRALATVLGGTFSAALLMGVSALGLWQLLLAAPLAFEVARGCGAAWLLWLGIGTWRSPVGVRPAAATAAQGKSPGTLCRDGFLLGIGNPKDLLFFGALLPQFVDPAAPRAPQLVCMFVTWALIDVVAMSGYAALGQRLFGWLADAQRRRWFQRASGAALMVSGLAMGVAHPALGR